MPPSRTPLKRQAMKRSHKRLPARSARRIEEGLARAAATEFVKARDGGCVWRRFVVSGWDRLTDRQRAVARRRMACIGDVHMHEPGHSRNVDRLDPANGVALCDGHNGLVEDEPDMHRRVGLLTEGANGLPLRRHIDL